MRRFLTIFLTSTWVLFFTTSALFADEAAQAQPIEYPPAIGEIFGKPVLKEDFEFVLKTVGIFNVSSQEPKNDGEKKSEAWKHLIFLREAESRKVDVSDSEVQAELTRLLAEKNIRYGSLEYHEFVKQTFSETSVVFESRMRNLLRVKKMMDAIMHPPPPTITEADAKQKFLNQYNSMLVEFINFPTLEEAKAFYKKISKKKWDEEKKKNSKFSTPTGHISLEALIDLWQVPQADAYRIHALPIGSIAEPAKMYKGYGVFRITEKKTADLKEYTSKKKEEYLKALEQVYYYDKTQRVIQDIIKRADMKDYANDKIMVMQTSLGAVEIRLFPSKAPKACENFIKLSENNYYNGTVFHRVIKGFMIQGGDPTATGTGGESIWGKPFEDEVWDDLQFDHAGLLAMANSGPATNGSQFFITVAPTPHLNKKHTIFGEVISGYEHVKAISETATGPQDKPVADQKIIKLNLKKWPTSLVFNS